MRSIVGVCAGFILALTMSDCAPSRPSFVSVLQRELNENMHYHSRHHGEPIRGYRAYPDHIDIIIDHRYGNFDDDVARGAAIDLSLDEAILDDDVRYAAWRSGVRIDPKTFTMDAQADDGQRLGRMTLTQLRANNILDNGKHRIDMASWQKNEAKLPISSTPSPLIALSDSCDQAQSQLGATETLATQDPKRALDKVLHASSVIDDCVTNQHYWIKALANSINALANHELGNSAEAQTDATLAAQLFEKCSATLYGTRQGAECQTSATQMTTLQSQWLINSF